MSFPLCYVPQNIKIQGRLIIGPLKYETFLALDILPLTEKHSSPKNPFDEKTIESKEKEMEKMGLFKYISN